jgi:tripartite ATP-independent transporter DctP family solute receptor
MDGPYGQKLSEDFLASTGMRNLCFGEVGFRHFTSGKTPIHSPKDLVGMKIRVQETPLYITEMKALGAQPTPIAFTEVYTAMQTGVVDGHENVIPSIIFAKLYEVQKNVTLDGHNYGVDWFVMNDKFFNSLPPDLQKVVQDAGKLACAEERRVNRVFTSDGVKILTEKGVSVYTPTAAELAQFKVATQQPVTDWLKTKVDQKWIDGMQAAVKDAEAKK